MNNQIIVAAILITGSGIARAYLPGGSGSITKVMIGGYVFLLVLAIVDAFGGPLADLSSSLAMLAAAYVVIQVFPWQEVIKLVQGK